MKLTIVLFLLLVISSLFTFKVLAQDSQDPAQPQQDQGSTSESTQSTTTLPGAQNLSKSNLLCVKVGSPSTDKPTACGTVPNSGTAPGGAASCPLPGKRVIGCGSFMSDPKYNRGVCAGPEPVNRGHCGTNYGCYAGSIEATKNSRRAHSIDVDAPPGERVYLPTINGKSLTWNYRSDMSYSVAPGDGGGYGHVFSADSDQGTWILHLLHTDPQRIPSPNSNGQYTSGDPVTTIAPTSYPHLHINIGLNPVNPNGGPGWLDPESLGMCTD